MRDVKNNQKILVLFTFFYLNHAIICAPATFYANIGGPVTLSCGGGQFGCYSTYAYTNYPSQMVMIPMQSQKYQVTSGQITINNVQATDAGFYTCSSNCQQIKYDQISYYLQPTSNGQPLDTTKNFVAIPPFPQDDATNIDKYYVVVSDERLNARNANVLSKNDFSSNKLKNILIIFK